MTDHIHGRPTVPAATVDLQVRLENLGRQVKEAREHLAAVTRQRDELVVRAVDEGVPVRTAARWIGVSHPTLIGIVARLG